MDWVSYLGAAIGGSAVTVAVSSALGVMFKDVFTAWMTRRVSLSLDQKAERYKHELARDMEHYKDELNRRQSVDRVKAEIRKSVAERLLDARLAALQDVNAQLSTLPAWLMGRMTMNFQRLEGHAELIDRFAAFDQAIDSNGLYFDSQFVINYHTLQGALLSYATEWASGTERPMSDPDAIAITTSVAWFKRCIDQMLKDLPSELSALIASDEA